MTTLDRLGPGRYIAPRDLAHSIARADTPDLAWRHIHCIATVMAEHGSPGIYEWQRPMVVKPGKPDHLSVDRGVWQLNSYWWPHVSDRRAYDLDESTAAVVTWLVRESTVGTKGAQPWDWKPLLDWQWHAYGTEFYNRSLGLARMAVNVVRDSHGLEPL